MAEKRLSQRVESTIQLKGKLYHVVDFKVKNISLGGVNILSNFQPHVGSSYTIFLIDNGVTQDFEVQVLRCEMETMRRGDKPSDESKVLLSIGARFLNLNDERNRFLESFLKKCCDETDVGYISDASKNSKKKKRH